MRAVYTTLAALAVAAGLSAQPRVQSINNDWTFSLGSGVKPVHRRVNGVEGVMVAPLLVFCAVVYGGTFDFNLSCGEIPLEILHSVTALPEVQRSLAGSVITYSLESSSKCPYTLFIVGVNYFFIGYL